MKTVLMLACALASAGLSTATIAQTVPMQIRVLVKQKDIGAESPLPRVGQFTILRNNTRYPQADCPDASNTNGELVCTVSCASNSRNATLLLRPPTSDLAVVVSGMAVPPARELQLSECKLTTPQPVVLVYKTVAAQLAELRLQNNAVYMAATAGQGIGARIKPFPQAQGDLEALAKNEANRPAIQQLAELARMERERQTAMARAKEELAAAPSVKAITGLDGYAVGMQSVLLKAQAVDAVGAAQAAAWVKVSPEPVELDKSISRVTRSLGQKNVLADKERLLERTATEMAAGAMSRNTYPESGTYGTGAAASSGSAGTTMASPPGSGQ